jgi:hypothetical protein
MAKVDPLFHLGGEVMFLASFNLKQNRLYTNLLEFGYVPAKSNRQLDLLIVKVFISVSGKVFICQVH